jgi:hypothetical protein
VDELEDFETSIIGSFGKGNLLLRAEVCGNSDDS